MENKIVCAAIKKNDIIIAGVRHWDSGMHKLKGIAFPDIIMKDAEQGFLDNKGDFHNRKDAMKIANKAHQVVYCKAYDKNGNVKDLYSEDLY